MREPMLRSRSAQAFTYDAPRSPTACTNRSRSAGSISDAGRTGITLMPVSMSLSRSRASARSRASGVGARGSIRRASSRSSEMSERWIESDECRLMRRSRSMSRVMSGLLVMMQI